MKVRPLTRFVHSARLLRRRPVVSIALGGAIILSIGSVFCGLGLLAAPWFGCELYAFQLMLVVGDRPIRSWSWVAAGAFILGAFLMVTASASVSGLGAGLDLPLVETQNSAGMVAIDLRNVALSAGGVLLATLYFVPFVYAPLVLIDRGGSLGGAALESTRLVMEDGFASHLALVVLSHIVMLMPIPLAAALAGGFMGRGVVPLAILAALFVLSVSIPLGQGMIVSAWAERRSRLVPPAEVQQGAGTPRPLAVMLTFLLLAPGLALALVLTSLMRPSLPDRAALIDGSVVLEAHLREGERQERQVPGTALSIVADREAVAIVASDGGGVGRLPGMGQAIKTFRVLRHRDAFAVEFGGEAVRHVVWVNRAGVRLDDDFRARLSDRVPTWGLLGLALALLATPLLLGRVLVSLAELRRSSAKTEDVDQLPRNRSQVIRKGWLAAVLLLPIALMALAVGLMAHS